MDTDEEFRQLMMRNHTVDDWSNYYRIIFRHAVRETEEE